MVASTAAPLTVPRAVALVADGALTGEPRLVARVLRHTAGLRARDDFAAELYAACERCVPGDAQLVASVAACVAGVGGKTTETGAAAGVRSEVHWGGVGYAGRRRIVWAGRWVERGFGVFSRWGEEMRDECARVTRGGREGVGVGPAPRSGSRQFSVVFLGICAVFRVATVRSGGIEAHRSASRWAGSHSTHPC